MWTTRPIFISSTFVDMQAERDQLRRFVFPALEERLRERRVHLEWVDLRVGVAAAGVTDAVAREAQVLKVCFSEIRRCRPFLLVLVGDRYGWRPPIERVRAIAAEEGLDFDPVNRSVTELEVEYGALGLGSDSRAVVYFRAPFPYAEFPPELAQKLGAATADDAALLDRLKQRIANVLPGQVRHYELTWSGEDERFNGLDSWALRVFEDLWDALSADLAADASHALTWQDEERAALEAFVEQRVRGFVGRAEVLEMLRACATSTAGPWGVCLTGEAGAGKSAVFAALYRRAYDDDVVVLAHAASASPRSASTDLMLRRWIEELARVGGMPVDIAADASAEDVRVAFAVALRHVAAQRRVLVLIDALDQFEAGVQSRHLAFLPKDWPANARLITTAIPGEASAALAERDVRMQALPPINESEADAIFSGVCARYHCTMEPEVVRVILEKRDARGALAAGQPLWLVLAAEELNLVDADDLERARVIYSGRAAEQLRALLVDMATALPAEIAGLYRASFAQAEELFGAALAQSFIYLMALGRGGWRELDFSRLLPRFSGEAWDPLQFGLLRRVFRGQVGQVGVQGQWNCLHGQMRAAALAHLAEKRAPERALHGFIADHLLALPRTDPLRCSEAMRHLIASENWLRAAAYMSDETASDAEREGATEALADLIASTDTWRPALEALLAAPQPESDLAAQLAENCLLPVNELLARRAGNALRQAFLAVMRSALERLVAAKPDALDRIYDLSGCRYLEGTLLEEAGQIASARASFETALKLAESINEKAPGDQRALGQLMVVSQKLSDVLREAGDLDRAQTVNRTAVAVARQVVAMKPQDAAMARELAVALERQAALLAARGDLTGAETLQDEAIKAARRACMLAQDAPVSVESVALALIHKGELQERRADLRGAEASTQEGLTLLEGIVARNPDMFISRANLAVAHGMLANLRLRCGDSMGAEQAFAQARKALELLVARDPNNAVWRRSLAISMHSQAKLLLAEERYDAAREPIEMGIALIEPLAAQDPDDLQWVRDLGSMHAQRADLRAGTGDKVGALDSARTALGFTERWAHKDAANTDAQQDLATRHDELGHILLDSGDEAGAERAFQTGIGILQKLVQHDGANTSWRRNLAAAQSSLSDVMRKRRDYAGAARAGADMATVLGEMAADNPDSLNAAFKAAAKSVQLGEDHLLAGDEGAAIAAFTKGLSVRDSVPPPDLRDLYRNMMSSLYLKLGSALKENGQPQEAAARLREGLEFLQQKASADPHRAWRLNVAYAGCELGEVLGELGQARAARQAIETGLEAWSQLARTEATPEDRRGLAWAQLKLARQFAREGDAASAFKAAAPARAAMAEREREDTKNAMYAVEYREWVEDMTRLLHQRQEWSALDKLLQESIPFSERELAIHPEHNGTRLQLAMMCWSQAQMKHKAGAMSAVYPLRAKTRDHLRELDRRGFQLDAQLRALLHKLETKG